MVDIFLLCCLQPDPDMAPSRHIGFAPVQILTPTPLAKVEDVFSKEPMPIGRAMARPPDQEEHHFLRPFWDEVITTHLSFAPFTGSLWGVENLCRFDYLAFVAIFIMDCD